MRKVVLFISIFLGFSPALVSAEFHCEAKVGYTVELTSKPAASPPAADSKETPPAAPASSAHEVTVYLAVVEGKGADEAAAKSVVQRESGRQVERVREECRVRHENVGGCIASKFQTNAAVLRGLGFQARKALEEALQADCEAQRGICRKSEVAAPVCQEIVAKVVETAAPEGDAKGKEDKKKAKK